MSSLRLGVWVTALVLASAAFGCKSESEAAAGGAVDEATFKSSLAADHCARVKDCCGLAKQSFDEALCEKQFAAATFGASGGADGGAGGAAAGSAIAFDGAAAAACLESLKAQPQACASLFASGDADAPTGGPIRLRDACSRALHGTKKVGEACTSSVECAPNDKGFAYCNPSLAPAGGSGSGACEEVSAGVGQCGEQGGSPGGTSRFFVCMPEGDKVMPCENGYCAKIWHEGDKCRDFSDGKCEAGLTCQNPGADGWGTCTGQPHAGSPCASGACAPDAYCDSGTCAAKKAAGQACKSANECLAPASACDGGVCAVPAGQMCTMGH